MESELTRAQHYRDQARHLRTLADEEANEESRKALIGLAENYERLCQACLEHDGKK